MQTLIALLVAAAAACTIARPPGPTEARSQALGEARGPPPPPPPPLSHDLVNYLLPRLLAPHYESYDDGPQLPPEIQKNYLLNKELNHLNQIEEEEDLMKPYDVILYGELSNLYMQDLLDSPMDIQGSFYHPERTQPNFEALRPISMTAPLAHNMFAPLAPPQTKPRHGPQRSNEYRKQFAFTPLDKEFYENSSVNEEQLMGEEGHHEGGRPNPEIVLEPPRQIRQNPNLSKQKHLLEPDLGKLKTGLANKDYRLPVSLLPSNLRWLKVNHADKVENDHEERSQEEGESGRQHRVHVLESAADPAETIYGVALIAAVGAALTMTIVGFAFGWYTLSKKAKAAADVDYPAYGVTGPTADSSGDRKLAHSAHMYHYQHQKQQIIAMERNGMEHRSGSISDPESEEENEEGDYTVYECPGFATTGDMEVKNPLFSEDPTPVTPGKCEVVKPQPKD